MQKGKTPFIVKSQDLRLYLYTPQKTNKQKKKDQHVAHLLVLFFFLFFLSFYLDIRRQEVIFHAHLNTFNTSLEESASFETDPDAEHGGISLANGFEECSSGAQLAEDRQST